MEPLLSLVDLTVSFATMRGRATAVDGVSFDVGQKHTVGVVGESGCGKSVTSQAILRLIQPPGRIDSGKVVFNGVDLVTMPVAELQKVRGAKIAMIFQEPMTALNPVFTMGEQIAEAVMIHKGVGKKEAHALAIESLLSVGIPSPEKRVNEYPHQLSGGMRQRGMIAMALSCDPDLIIADEPTTALDVTVQAQILDLLAELKESRGLSMILITHDLGVVAQNCDDVVVMYAGKVVEQAPVATLFETPAHPYTRGLLESIPARQPKQGRLREIAGSVPGINDTPSGCAFHPRCPEVMEKCKTKPPPFSMVNNETGCACWLHRAE
jgi:oligopeptide/dipeptide ABC transporter ATP-binding protein